MKNMSRRDVCVALPALAAVGAGVTEALEAQTHTSEFPPPQTAPPGTVAAKAVPATTGGTLGPAHAIQFDQVPATTTANGGDRRVMLHGRLETGEMVEVHQSMQTPGTPAPPLHVIQHSEMILVREGTLRFDTA